MQKGYKIFWSKESKNRFNEIICYLRAHWTEKEVSKFILQLKNFERLVTKLPRIYSASQIQKDLRKAILSKHNSVVFKIDEDKKIIRVLTIFDNRQDPKKL